jgi:pyruvate dehydrogenase E1 component beta subunit
LSGNYIQHVVQAISQAARLTPNPVLIVGENIDSGSRIGGMARGLEVKPTDRILNVGNCELTHCGVGLGVMLDGGHYALFMKQLDFLLLGLDQLVNTYNFMRAHRVTDDLGSFTIYLIVCDQGFQGSQSSLNSLSDVASLTRIPIYCLNAEADVDEVVGREFFGRGIRVIAVSQRQFGMEPLTLGAVERSHDLSVFKYGDGDDLTLMSFNFALRHVSRIRDRLEAAGFSVDLFHQNYVPGPSLDLLIESVERTGRLMVIDDSKSYLKMADHVIAQLRGHVPELVSVLLTRRDLTEVAFGATADMVDFEERAVQWVESATR